MPGAPLPKFHGFLTIDAASNNFTIEKPPDPVRSITLTSTSYYIRGATTDGSNMLVEHIQAQVRAAGAEFATTFFAEVSDSGFVTLRDTGGSFNLVWSDAELRRILGFGTNPRTGHEAAQGSNANGDLTGAATYTGVSQHKYGWYPDVALAELSGDVEVIGERHSDAVVRRALSGQVTQSSYSAELVDRNFEFVTLSAPYAYPTRTNVGGSSLVLNRSFEEFWQQVGKPGLRFRWYPDRSVQNFNDTTSTAPPEYVPGARFAREGTRLLERQIRAIAKWYTLAFDAHRFVA